MIKTCKLKTLGEFKNGLNFAKHKIHNPIKIISIPDFGDRIVPDYLSLSLVDSSVVTPDYYLKNNDIIFVRSNGNRALVGRTMIIDGLNEKIGYSGFCIRFRVTNDDIDPYYLLYFLKSPAMRQQLSRTRQSNINNVNQDSLGDLTIRMPEISEQKAITHVISSIDRKISLNSTINTELENAARTLYDYWFTQFDFPDVNGNPYKSSGGEMVWNKELKREIPKGWRVKPLGEMFNISRGSIITEKTAQPGNIKVVSAGVTYSYFHSTSNRPRNTITISSSGANAGYLNFWYEEIYASDCITVRGNNDINTILVYQFLQGMQSFISSKSTGSAQPHVYPHDIEELRMCEIPDKLIKKILPLMLEINNQIAIKKRESDELTKLRDFLLPLLMNGQVRVAVSDKNEEQSAIAKEEAVFKRLVLSAYILDNICDEPTAGRVKFEKLLFLSEQCAQLPLHSEFQRAAAGPYDAKALYSIEDQLKQNQWFKRQKVKGESRAYTRLGKVEDYKQYVGTNFDAMQKSVIDKLIDLFKTSRTIQCEIVATLYGAWNDFLLEGIQPADSRIVDEVLTNWNESKQRIGRNRWLKAIQWMRDNGIVPVGYGLSTKGKKVSN